MLPKDKLNWENVRRMKVNWSNEIVEYLDNREINIKIRRKLYDTLNFHLIIRKNYVYIYVKVKKKKNKTAVDKRKLILERESF